MAHWLEIVMRCLQTGLVVMGLALFILAMSFVFQTMANSHFVGRSKPEYQQGQTASR